MKSYFKSLKRSLSENILKKQNIEESPAFIFFIARNSEKFQNGICQFSNIHNDQLKVTSTGTVNHKHLNTDFKISRFVKKKAKRPFVSECVFCIAH